jgi:hypothetical protein
LPALPAGSAELPLRRLTKVQYVNTLQDVVRQAIPSQAGSIVGAINSYAVNYPGDAMVTISSERHGGFFRMDQAVQQGHIDSAYEVGVKLAVELTTSSRIGALMGACATDTNTSNDAACLSDFVRRFGRIAFRKPLTDAEVTLFRNIAGTTPVAPAAVADVISAMLSAPQALYQIEHGQATMNGNRANLTAHELAARLSYHFWQTIPDAELAQLADNGQLLTPSVYSQQVARLAADARTDATIKEFFAQWFRLQEMEPLDGRVGDPVYDAFRGSFTPTAASRQNAMDEVTDMVTYLHKTGGKLQDVLTDKRSFAKTQDIATLYGMPVWNGSAAPQAFTDPARSGLLSRIAFVATGSANTRPIIKGYRIRSALLCQSLPPPPPEAAAVTIELSTTKTTRQVVEELTQKPGTACVACHGMMNPMGFASENFDSLGRTRSAQKLYDAAGKLVNTLPVDTSAVPKVTGPDSRSATDSHQLTQYILQSGEFERCFAQHYFRFTFGRGEREGDREAITDLMNAARAGGTLRDMLARIALRTEFQSRTF